MAELRRCIGSPTFGIEAHDAPVDLFPIQASQKDGLGRMCRTHWNAYTGALRKAAVARKAATDEAVTDATPAKATPSTGTAEGKKTTRRRQRQDVGEVAQEPPIE